MVFVGRSIYTVGKAEGIGRGIFQRDFTSRLRDNSGNVVLCLVLRCTTTETSVPMAVLVVVQEIVVRCYSPIAAIAIGIAIAVKAVLCIALRRTAIGTLEPVFIIVVVQEIVVL